LTWINCDNNYLSLSELFAISEKLQSNGAQIFDIMLGSQILPAITAILNTEIEFADKILIIEINIAF